MKVTQLLITEKLGNNHCTIAMIDDVEIENSFFELELQENETIFINGLYTNKNPYGDKIRYTNNIENIIDGLSMSDTLQNKMSIGLLEQIKNNADTREVENINVVLYEH